MCCYTRMSSEKASVATAAVTAPEFQAAWATTREGLQAGYGDAQPLTFRSLTVGKQAAVLGAAAALLALSARGVVDAERWAFGNGQARAAAGRRFPHSGPSLPYGVLTIELRLVPTPHPTPV